LSVQSIERYPGGPFHRFLAERRLNQGQPLPVALRDVAEALARWKPDLPLRYVGDPPTPLGMDESSLARSLADVEGAQERGVPRIFRLVSEPGLGELSVFFESEATRTGRIGSLWFSLSASAAEAPFLRMIGEVSTAFGAYRACIEDERLLLLYRSGRAAERTLAAVPPALQAFVPPPVPSEGKTLPRLLVPQEFDRTRVPDAVWWINFWNREQVETLGRTRVNSADWFQRLEQPDGALLLVATSEPTSAEDPGHLEQLRRICQQLYLSEAQFHYRFPRE
jgi:hypothetical protein